MIDRAHQGFSLIELMVTVSVLAILLALGAPAFSEWMMNSRIRTVAESVQNGLRTARNEAVQRATAVRFEFDATTRSPTWTVCQLDTGKTTCATSATTSVIDRWNAAGGADQILVGTSKDSSQVANSAFATAITTVGAQGVTFTPLGRPSDYNVTSMIRVDADADTTKRKNSRRQVVYLTAGGQVRMCDPDARVQNLPMGCPHA